jgi:hypothetical protein
MDKKQEIIQEIKRLANLVAPAPLTKKLFIKESGIPFSNVRYQFGSFNRAVEAAGLKPNPKGIPVSGYKKINDDELLTEIGELWKRVGERPTDSHMNSQGQYSIKPYKKRWGSFKNAVDAFISKYGTPIKDSSFIFQEIAAHTSVAPVVIPKTHKPSGSTSTKKKLFFGEPLDFRGLRYAPINEQGVVYLFGMVSRELGFLIESIRTDFPDCEGKRCIDQAGTKWEHVRIEFEWKSSHFEEHGHDPDSCDLIVCWIHDWSDSPIEVLELRTEIRKLSSR